MSSYSTLNCRTQALETTDPKSHYARLSITQKASIVPLDFSTLPTEIRLEIYEYLITAVKTCSITNNETDKGCLRCRHGQFRWCPDSPSLAILRTCKQILHEARDILYKKNILEVFIEVDRKPWPNISIGKSLPLTSLHLPSIRHFRVQLGLYNDAKAISNLDWSIIRCMSNLELLEIAITHGDLNGSSFIDRKYSSFLAAIVKVIIECTPANVNLESKPWNSLVKDFKMPILYSYCFVRLETVQEIADRYGDFRGRKAIQDDEGMLLIRKHCWHSLYTILARELISIDLENGMME